MYGGRARHYVLLMADLSWAITLFRMYMPTVRKTKVRTNPKMMENSSAAPPAARLPVARAIANAPFDMARTAPIAITIVPKRFTRGSPEFTLSYLPACHLPINSPRPGTPAVARGYTPSRHFRARRASFPLAYVTDH